MSSADVIGSAAARYTVWPLSGLPGQVRARASARAAYMVAAREPGPADPAVAGWIELTGAADRDRGVTLRQAFMRIVGGQHREGTPALLISPSGQITLAAPAPAPAVTDPAFRRTCLGQHLVIRLALTRQMDMWSSAESAPVNPLATNLAHGYGFSWRRVHGPVMLCTVGPEAARQEVTSQMVAQLLSTATVPGWYPVSAAPARARDLAALLEEFRKVTGPERGPRR